LPHRQRDSLVRQWVLVLASISWLSPVWAKPPINVDPDSPEARWFQSAYTPYCHSCCGDGDGSFVEARADPDIPSGWDVRLKDQGWVPVPSYANVTSCRAEADGTMTPLGPYPTEPHGYAVVWIFAGSIFCFSPPGWLD
jgi:hypothetical protein